MTQVKALKLCWMLLATILVFATKAVHAKIADLTDDNFQHLTQVGEGATTGNWFVLFCNSNSETCRKLAPTWEELDKALLEDNPGGIVLGRVEKKDNIAVSRRFRVPPDDQAYIILLKGDQLTLYIGAKTLKKMKDFADAIGETANRWVPVPAEMGKLEAYLDDKVAQLKKLVKENKQLVGGVVVGVLVLGIVLGKLISMARADRKAEVDVKKGKKTD